ncbi:neutral/alkaline non-lysosomal ceramidase N-terminal domain-containing protein [Breznakia pachnodae]|uniref:Neutral/alkaline non-lysosomal ceramidase N-terminal domain-containing protein n=1 Tax=Breznakia pachnodae TaxID=265178 RepID=A0ABU0E509_9FIRM|nr:neutral/alkaline non-lysosomal ceramidase N-terminal domain-containing protein [Breznakia pachnodae]MDQ0361996.1 hypothetical protein [Breznakia pachnodae]
MKVGSSRYCLTPEKEFYLIGYRSDNRYEPATGVHDDIYCNSLLFEQDGKKVFIFSADVIEFEESMADDVKTLLHNKYGIERDLVLLCATHDHSSVVSYHRSWYTNKFDQEYYDFFIQTILSSYEDCLDSLQTATAAYGKEVIRGYYGNRNHPGQLADNEVIVVKFHDEAGKPFAGFVNWAVHSTVLSADNTMLTSDLAGEVSKKLYDSFGFYPAMIVGAAADSSNRNERKGSDFHELERVSTALAKHISEIDTNNEIILGSIRYQTLFHVIHHNMETVHEELTIEINKMQEQLAEENNEDKIEFYEKKIHNLKKELDVHNYHLDIKGVVINLGNIQLFVFPGELGSKFGIEMKDSTISLGIICGYTNGYYEYFMPKEEYGLSFETIGSKIPKGDPEKIIKKFILASKRLNDSKI